MLSRDGMIFCRREHQKTQKRSQKLHSVQDKMKQCQEDMAKWVGDREKARSEIQEKLDYIED